MAENLRENNVTHGYYPRPWEPFFRLLRDLFACVAQVGMHSEGPRVRGADGVCVGVYGVALPVGLRRFRWAKDRALGRVSGVGLNTRGEGGRF
jgi:hypothetical protein